MASSHWLRQRASASFIERMPSLREIHLIHYEDFDEYRPWLNEEEPRLPASSFGKSKVKIFYFDLPTERADAPVELSSLSLVRFKSVVVITMKSSPEIKCFLSLLIVFNCGKQDAGSHQIRGCSCAM